MPPLTARELDRWEHRFARSLEDLELLYASDGQLRSALGCLRGQPRPIPVATGISLCLYLNCEPEAGRESSGSLALFWPWLRE